MAELDLLSYLAVGTAGGAVTIPLTVGSRLFDDPGHEIPEVASPVYGEVNWSSPPSQPVIYAQALCFPGWFNLANMIRLFGNQDLVGQRGSWGVVQWRYCNGTPRRWSRCKLAMASLIWGPNQPLVMEMVLLPHGARLPPITSFRPAATWGRCLSSNDVRYTGLNKVVGGALVINNRLSPDASLPHFRSADARAYFRDWHNHVHSVGLELTQYSDATLVQDTHYSSVQGAFSIHFHAPGGARQLTATLNALKPILEENLQGGIGLVTRRYTAIKARGSSLKFRFS